LRFISSDSSGSSDSSNSSSQSSDDIFGFYDVYSIHEPVITQCPEIKKEENEIQYYFI
jgi:hypothetical protein